MSRRVLTLGDVAENLADEPFGRLLKSEECLNYMKTSDNRSNTSLGRYRLGTDDQLVFLHVPKTAGTTLTNIVMRHIPDRICPARHWDTPPDWRDMPGRKNLSDLEQELAQYQYFTGHFRYDICRLLPRVPLFITILRNPVERVMSLYKYIRRQEHHPLYSRVKEMSLQEFAAWDIPGLPGENKNRYVFDLGTRFDICRPRDIKFATPVTTDRLAVAQERLESFAFIGLTERFNDSVLLLSYLFHWEPILCFANSNVAATPTSQDDLPSEVLETIIENNREDIILYERAREIFDQQWHQMIEAVFMS